MLRATGWKLAGLGMLAAVLVMAAGNSAAQPKKPNEKHDATALNHTLRDVINAGAKLYNEEGDHVGCYRLYQGSLLTVRPFVPPDAQKMIDSGLANAEKMATFARKAFELRRVLDELRAKMAPAEEKTDDKKPVKTEEKKVGPGDTGLVTGKITFNDKPVQGGYSITLVPPQGVQRGTAIREDGSFQFPSPIGVGEYRIYLQPIPNAEIKGPLIPARYQSVDASGLAIRVQAGKQNVELNLVK